MGSTKSDADSGQKELISGLIFGPELRDQDTYSGTMAALRELVKGAVIKSDNATYTDSYIEAPYEYRFVEVEESDEFSEVPTVSAYTNTRLLKFRTERQVPRVGVMLAGLGGNNGTTFVAGILANRDKMSWRTKTGIKNANWYGSLLLSSTAKLGVHKKTGFPVCVPLSSLLPMLRPETLVIGGWDISGIPLGDAMRRAEVLDVQLQDMLYERMQEIRPLPAVYIPDFIAANQSDRADNVLFGTLQEQMDKIRQDICNFRQEHSLDKVIVLWTATTERFTNVTVGFSVVFPFLIYPFRRVFMIQKTTC